MNALSKLLVTVTLFSLALSACAPAVALAGQNTPAAPVTPPQPTPTTPPAPSSTPVAGTPTPTEVSGAPDNGGIVVTLDYNNRVLALRPDDTFLLKLGEGYIWDLSLDNQSVVSRIPNIAVIRGAQGIYQAHLPGIATLTAQGDPVCRQVKPACGLPSVSFTLHIEVMK